MEAFQVCSGSRVEDPGHTILAFAVPSVFYLFNDTWIGDPGHTILFYRFTCVFYPKRGRCGREKAFAIGQTSPFPSAGRGVAEDPLWGLQPRGNHFLMVPPPRDFEFDLTFISPLLFFIIITDYYCSPVS
jgi:hypothetical protein